MNIHQKKPCNLKLQKNVILTKILFIFLFSMTPLILHSMEDEIRELLFPSKAPVSPKELYVNNVMSSSAFTILSDDKKFKDVGPLIGKQLITTNSPLVTRIIASIPMQNTAYDIKEFNRLIASMRHPRIHLLNQDKKCFFISIYNPVADPNVAAFNSYFTGFLYFSPKEKIQWIPQLYNQFIVDAVWKENSSLIAVLIENRLLVIDSESLEIIDTLALQKAPVSLSFSPETSALILCYKKQIDIYDYKNKIKKPIHQYNALDTQYDFSKAKWMSKNELLIHCKSNLLFIKLDITKLSDKRLQMLKFTQPNILEFPKTLYRFNSLTRQLAIINLESNIIYLYKLIEDEFHLVNIHQLEKFDPIKNMKWNEKENQLCIKTYSSKLKKVSAVILDMHNLSLICTLIMDNDLFCHLSDFAWDENYEGLYYYHYFLIAHINFENKQLIRNHYSKKDRLSILFYYTA